MASRTKQNLTDLIHEQAYELYAARGYADGLHDEDWKQAESELEDGSKAPKTKSKKKAVQAK